MFNVFHMIKMHGDLIGITPGKRDIRELKCKCCGAPLEIPKTLISVVECKFCGSVFDIDMWDNSVSSTSKTEVKVEPAEVKVQPPVKEKKHTLLQKLFLMCRKRQKATYRGSGNLG